MRALQRYVDEQMLFCIRHNAIYPQDVQVTKTVYLTFGSVGLTVTRLTKNRVFEKHVNGWPEMTAEEINTQLREQEYIEAA